VNPSRIIAVIPARGGSKGIPRKNLRLLAGKPLLAYSVEHARSTPAIARTFVSTDDDEIAAVARRYGAEVIRRPAEISGDEATSESALLHTLESLRQTEQYEPDLLVFLQATSPLRRPGDIQNAIETLQREQADSLFSACPLHGFVWRKEGEQHSSFTYDYRHRQRRQELGVDLVENGSIYVFKPWVLREHANRLGGRIACYRMHPLDSFQIDEPDDLVLFEQLLAIRPPVSTTPDLAIIQFLVLDFDGVLTDNRVLVDQQGKEAVWCHRGDGWGIARLKEAGVDVMVLSTEKNPVVAARCRKLEIACLQGCDDKREALQQLVAERGLEPAQVAFVGNDVNDLDGLRWVGVPIAVSDAVVEVQKAACLVTSCPGGRGAVREVADWIISARRPGQKSIQGDEARLL